MLLADGPLQKNSVRCFILGAVPIAEPLTAGVHLALEQAQLQIVAMFLLPTVQRP